MNIAPKEATEQDLAIPDGAIIYHLSEDQYRALRGGGMARELIEIEWLALASVHLRDSIWIVGPHERHKMDRPEALAVVHEDGQILYAAPHAPAVEMATDGNGNRLEVVDPASPLGQAIEEVLQEHGSEAFKAVEAVVAEPIKALGPEQWSDFLEILEVAVHGRFITGDEAAAHRANKVELVKEELGRIIKAIGNDSGADELARHARSAAVELLRELGGA